MTKIDKLGKFLREVSNWTWDEFARAEKDKQFTSNEAIIFALVRACALQKMEAIKIAVNRLDGKLKTPVRIEYPKIYYLYPNAGLQESKPGFAKVTDDPKTVNEALQIVEGELIPTPHIVEPEDPDLPSMGFRETLAKMSDYPRELPEAITELALQTEQWIRNQSPEPQEIPKVKSVVAAHLLLMAQNRNIDALSEVFDAIDGKLVETLQILGEDIYITSYATQAPEGAKVNKDGILEIEATKAQDIWAQKLGREVTE